MTNQSDTKRKQPGRPTFLIEPVVTTINIEKKLLQRVTKRAYGLGKSVSQWVSQAAKEKLARES